MAKLSFAQLKSIVADYVTANKISYATFEITRDNTALLVDKIAKIFTLDTSFIDKLEMFEGEELSFGKTIEEWQQDLMLPEAYSSSGDGAMSPHDPTYRPAFYSYTLGRKVIPTTIRNNDIERAVHFEEQFVELVAMKSKRLYDSVAVWRYEVKREILAKLIGLVGAVKTGASAYATNQNYSVGAYVKSGSPSQYGVVVKPITSGASDTNSWANAKANGFVIVLELERELAVPVDTNTGEAFIKAIKELAEISSDISEGHSLNGNTLGASEGLVLLLKQGVMPSIQVDTLAGAFQKEELAMPVEVKVIKDFGSDNTGVYAMLVDRRGVRLHNTYKAVRENFNGAGDFLNLFYHSEDTGFVSRNTFVCVIRPSV